MRKQIASILLLGLYLGAFKGYVALMDTESAEPLQIFPYAISSFPPADQRALDLGIPIRSREELSRRMEDFLS